MWEVASQCNGATSEHQVLLQIRENGDGDAWNVGASVRDGSREQKMCLRLVQTLSWREGINWGWATFGSAVDSGSVIDSYRGLCWQFPEALWTLPKVCCEEWRLFWRPIKLICLYLLFCLFFLIPFTELFRHTTYFHCQESTHDPSAVYPVVQSLSRWCATANACIASGELEFEVDPRVLASRSCNEIVVESSIRYPSYHLGTWSIQHYYRWCAHLGCQ